MNCIANLSCVLLLILELRISIVQRLTTYPPINKTKWTHFMKTSNVELIYFSDFMVYYAQMTTVA